MMKTKPNKQTKGKKHMMIVLLCCFVFFFSCVFLSVFSVFSFLLGVFFLLPFFERLEQLDVGVDCRGPASVPLSKNWGELLDEDEERKKKWRFHSFQSLHID